MKSERGGNLGGVLAVRGRGKAGETVKNNRLGRKPVNWFEKGKKKKGCQQSIETNERADKQPGRATRGEN